MLTKMPDMNDFLVLPSFKDGVTTARLVQVTQVVGDRFKGRFMPAFEDTDEMAFSDVKLGTNRFDSELRFATDDEVADGIQMALRFHTEKHNEAAMALRAHDKKLEELERMELHFPKARNAA